MKDFSFGEIHTDFDDHIRKSIRGYADLLSDSVKLGQYFIEAGTSVVDVGCSTGSFLENLRVEVDGCEKIDWIGIDIEGEFQKQWLNHKQCHFEQTLAEEYNFNLCSYVTSFFTLQFVPKNHRKTIVRNIYNGLIHGGAFVFAEKVYSQSAKIQDCMTFIHYDFKSESFSEKEILDKEERLRGVMRVMPENELVQLVEDAGFKVVECFWRNLNFLAWIAIK